MIRREWVKEHEAFGVSRYRRESIREMIERTGLDIIAGGIALALLIIAFAIMVAVFDPSPAYPATLQFSFTAPTTNDNRASCELPAVPVYGGVDSVWCAWRVQGFAPADSIKLPRGTRKTITYEAPPGAYNVFAWTARDTAGRHVLGCTTVLPLNVPAPPTSITLSP